MNVLIAPIIFTTVEVTSSCRGEIVDSTIKALIDKKLHQMEEDGEVRTKIYLKSKPILNAYDREEIGYYVLDVLSTYGHGSSSAGCEKSIFRKGYVIDVSTDLIEERRRRTYIEQS